MGLRVAQHLQAVFQPAQEPVSDDQHLAIGGVHLPGLNQRAQGRQQTALAQGRLAATANQLFFPQHIFITDFRRIATGITHFHLGHAGHRTQAFFRAPKTAHPEINILQLTATHGHGSSWGGGYRTGAHHPPTQEHRSSGQQQCQ